MLSLPHLLWMNHLLGSYINAYLSSFSHFHRKHKLWLLFVKNPIWLVRTHTHTHVFMYVCMCDTVRKATESSTSERLTIRNSLLIDSFSLKHSDGWYQHMVETWFSVQKILKLLDGRNRWYDRDAQPSAPSVGDALALICTAWTH